MTMFGGIMIRDEPEMVGDPGKDLIKKWEGLRTKAYLPTPDDVYTIGYGHTATAKPGMEIDEAEADRLLGKDIQWAKNAVNRLVTVPLNENQKGALTSLVFNIGQGAFERSNALQALNAGDVEEFKKQAFSKDLGWTKQAGKRLKGLVRRRAAEHELFDKPVERREIPEWQRQIEAGQAGIPSEFLTEQIAPRKQPTPKTELSPMQRMMQTPEEALPKLMFGGIRLPTGEQFGMDEAQPVEAPMEQPPAPVGAFGGIKLMDRPEVPVPAVEELAGMGPLEAAADVGLGTIETAAGVIGGAALWPFAQSARHGAVLGQIGQQWLGLVPHKTPEEIAQMGEEVAEYVQNLHGLLTPRTASGKASLELVGRAFQPIVDFSHWVAQGIDPNKHPNLHNLVATGAEVGLFAAIPKVIKTTKTIGEPVLSKAAGRVQKLRENVETLEGPERVKAEERLTQKQADLLTKLEQIAKNPEKVEKIKDRVQQWQEATISGQKGLKGRLAEQRAAVAEQRQLQAQLERAKITERDWPPGAIGPVPEGIKPPPVERVRPPVKFKTAQQLLAEKEAKTARLTGVNRQTLVDSILAPLKNERGAITIDLRPKETKRQQKILNNAQQLAKEAGMPLDEFLMRNGITHKEAIQVQEMLDTYKAAKPSKKDSKFAKEDISEDTIDSGIREIWNNPNYRQYYNFLKDEKRMINPYDGSGNNPGFARPMISKTTPELRHEYTDRSLFHEAQSPHHQFDYAYNLENNPSYDMFESYMVYHQNVANQKTWAKDLIAQTGSKKAHIQARKDLDKALEPIRKKLDLRMNESIKSQERIRLRQERINKMRVGDRKTKLELLQEKERSRLNAQLKTINKEMNNTMEKISPELAEKHASIRIMLDAEGRLPAGIELTPKEIKISQQIKDYFETSKQELIRNDIPVIEGDYTPNLWRAAVGAEGLGRVLGLNTKKVPVMLKFQHRNPNSRSWYPDMNTILDTYIPVVNKKIAYQPFLDRWRDARVEMPSQLRNYFDEWVNKNLRAEQPTALGRVANASLAFEYFRTIGLSLSVAFKHMLKLPHTIAEIGPTPFVRQAPRVGAVAADTAFRNLGWKRSAPLEKRLMDSFYNTQHIVETLEGAGLESAAHMLKTIPGSMTTFVEFMENGINVLATIESGVKRGVDPRIVQRRIWESILDANFRMGPDEFVWRKNSGGARAVTLYLNTPAKLLEHQAKLVRKAIRREKDNFGSSYGKKLMLMVASIGLAESIARSNDTTLLNSLLHMPHPHSLVETGEEIAGALAHPEQIDPGKAFSRTFPQLNKIYQTVKGRYNSKYYNSPMQSLFGIKALRGPKKSRRDTRRGRMGRREVRR